MYLITSRIGSLETRKPRSTRLKVRAQGIGDYRGPAFACTMYIRKLCLLVRWFVTSRNRSRFPEQQILEPSVIEAEKITRGSDRLIAPMQRSCVTALPPLIFRPLCRQPWQQGLRTTYPPRANFSISNNLQFRPSKADEKWVVYQHIQKWWGSFKLSCGLRPLRAIQYEKEVGFLGMRGS